MTAFWGCVIHPGAKPTPFVPPPDGSRLHISQATLGLGARNGERVAVMIHAGDEEKTSVLLCALRAGSTDTTHLDLILDEYAEFTLEGDTPVHLCGNYMPDMDLRSRLMYDEEEEEEDEDEDEDEEGALQSWMMAGYGAGMPFGGDDDDDDDEEYDEDEDEDEEEDELVPRKTTKKGGVVIQELNGEEDDEEEEEEEEEPAPRRQAGKHVEDDFIPLGGAAGAAGKKRPAQETAAQQGQQKKQAVSPGAGAPGSQAKQAQGGQKGRPESCTPGQPSPGPASGSASKPGSQFTDGPPGSQGSRKFTNGLEIIMLANGKPDGKVALPGKRVSMKYVGRLKSNGKVFDATKGAPFTFRLGIGEVIKGWDIGVKNMRVGDKRRLIIPPDLGYGSKGAPGAIPPNAWLEFDVELVSVQ